MLELALAVQRCGLYPGGHPTVDVALDQLGRRIAGLLRDREMISLGVARRQLIVEGVATDSSHPVLRVLADRLHRHRVAALVIRRGVDTPELAAALKVVAMDPEATDRGADLSSAQQLAEWPHIRFHGLTYEQLRLADELDAEDEDDGDEAGAGTAAAQLWVGLAQAALARGEAIAVHEARGADPDEVARAINEHAGTTAYDQVIVGFLLQLADELRSSGKHSRIVRRRVSQVITRLEPETMNRLLEMGGDVSQRGRFLHGAVRSLRPDAVLELMGAAAKANGQSISTSMLRLLRKLSGVAAGSGAASDEANAHLRQQVHELLENWSLKDPNPASYTQALEIVSRPGVIDDLEVLPQEHSPEPLRLVHMGLEVGTAGPGFRRAVTRLLEAGQVRELCMLIDTADGPNAAIDALWEQLDVAEPVRRLLMTDPVDYAALDGVLSRWTPFVTISLLLDRLSESGSRATRMGAFRRLAARGVPAARYAVERLCDPRWFVVRNMLALLNTIGVWPEDFSPLPYARSDQPTVRREALLLGTRTAAARDEAIELALGDADERVLRVGINAAKDGGLPARALPVVLRQITDHRVPSDVRVAMIRLLAGQESLLVLERLLELIMPERRTLLRRTKLAPRSPEMLAALAVVAAAKSPDPRAQTALQHARRSADAEVRTAAGAAA